MTRRRVAFGLATWVATAITLSAQSPAPRSTGAVMAPDRLARLDRVLQDYVDDGRLPGAVALVLVDGRPVYEKAFGWADKEAGRKMTPDALFRIASQTKAITSTAILMLMEEGRLQLTEPVSKYLPTFAKTTVAVRGANGAVEIVPAKRAITIKDLLTHTAGISYGTNASVASAYEAKGLGPAAGYGWYTADKDEPVCETMDRLGTLPFVAQPGEAWVYGYNTDILGCVVERVSGQPLDVFLTTRILAPLKMTDTFFFVPRDQAGRLTAVYASDANGLAVRAPDGAPTAGWCSQITNRSKSRLAVDMIFPGCL